MKNKLSLLISGGLFAFSGMVTAHSNFVENPVDGSRSFIEDRRYFLKLNLAHTCGHGDTNYDIIHAGIVFPNGPDSVITKYSAMTASGEPDTTSEMTTLPSLDGVLATYNKYAPPGALYGANGVMSIKPIPNANWESIVINKDSVPAYYNHGVNENDVRSIYWVNHKSPQTSQYGGGFSNDYAQNVEFVTTLGQLQGCTAKVRVYTASMDACANGNAYAWTSNYTPMMSEELVNNSNGHFGVSINYAAYFDIVRDTNKNPMDESCGAGEMVTVEPSAADIDMYLGNHAHSWVGASSNGSSQECPAGQHWMNGGCMDNNAM